MDNNYLLDPWLVYDGLRSDWTVRGTQFFPWADELDGEDGHDGRARYVQHLAPSVVHSRAKEHAQRYFAGFG